MLGVRFFLLNPPPILLCAVSVSGVCLLPGPAASCATAALPGMSFWLFCAEYLAVYCGAFG